MQFNNKRMQMRSKVLSKSALVAVALLFALVMLVRIASGKAEDSKIAQTIESSSYTFLQSAPTVNAKAVVRMSSTERMLPTMQEAALGTRIAVTLIADGKTILCEVESGMTVAEILAQEAITCGEYDLVTPNLTRVVKRDQEITVQRVERTFETVQEEIPYEVIYRETCLLGDGKTRQAQVGENGLQAVTYVTRVVDGVAEGERHKQTEILSNPVDEIVLVGAPAVISPLAFEDVPLDENGVPVGYSKVLTEQIATGYSARRGAKTASGRHAIPGHVAVDPKDIPYGTRMYITSADGSFVYGYAIAADTGVGLMQDIIDVDLFYDTYRESALNGRKIVNIYILD